MECNRDKDNTTNCSLKPGPKGDKGSIGQQGGTGPKGDKGVVGARGDRGGVGPQGPVGDRGPKGDRGLVGARGDRGLTGPQGSVGYLFFCFYEPTAASNIDLNLLEVYVNWLDNQNSIIITFF